MNAQTSALLLVCLALAAGLFALLAHGRRLARHATRASRHRDRVARQRRALRVSDRSVADGYWAQVRSAVAPVLITTPEGTILASSNAVTDMFGFANEQELRRRPALDLYANPRDRAQLTVRLSQHGYVRSGEFRMRHRDGHDFHVLATVRLVNLPDGKTCYESVLTDITQMREAAEERHRLVTQLHLARKLELVGQLASGIAHEINTPMQFVGDNMNFLKQAFERLSGSIATHRLDEALLADVTSAFDGSFEGIARVSETVRAMKEFAHPGDVEIAATDLNQALRTTLVVARNEYKHAAEVKLELHDILPVDCRRAEINKVFLNLVVNAAHAIEARGAGVPGVIRIRTSNIPDGVRIEIADNGCGIPSAVLPRIFDPFFTTKTIGKGSGQGLAIARNIIKDHGGDISVASSVGEGTTFTITLPHTISPEPDFFEQPAQASGVSASIG